MKASILLIPLIVGLGIGRGFNTPKQSRIYEAVQILDDKIKEFDNYCTNHQHYGLNPTLIFEFCSSATALAIYKMELFQAMEKHADVNIKYNFTDYPTDSTVSVIMQDSKRVSAALERTELGTSE